MKNYLLTLTCFCMTLLHAQNPVILRGKVLNQSQVPINLATVFLNKADDATLINYTISDVSGEFKLQIPSAITSSSAVFIVSADGYVDFVKKIDKINSSIFLDSIVLKKKDINELDEVVITAYTAPVKIKNDTLEFNAKSFDVRPDATVKSLLEQLPGVMVNESGKILVNGQEVNEILINGKPFFDENGQVILNNLPANIINKIQITDYKTKEQKLSNENSTSQEKSINLTIEEDKNKGYFGNITGGVGSDERYEGSLLLNYFNNDTKISVLASTNNINSLGFSNNEIFDNLVSGRNISLSSSNSGSLSINGFKLGADKGIYTNKMLGFNYSDSFNKKINLGTSYIFNRVDFDNNSKTRTENLIPDNIYITDSENTEKSISKSQTANVQLEVKLNKKTTLQIDPKVDYQQIDNHESGFSSTFNESNQLVNNQKLEKKSNSEQKKVGTYVALIHNFDKKDRNFIAVFLADFKKSKLNDINKSENNFFETNTSDNRNQQLKTNKSDNVIDISARYKEPITLNQEISLGVNYGNKYYDWDRNALNFNDLSQDYSQLDTNLTFSNSMQVNEVKPNINYRYKFEKGYINFVAASKITDFAIKNNFDYKDFYQRRTNVLPEFSLNFSFQITKIRKVNFFYSYSEDLNSFNQLAAVTDFANPFLTITGNPDLKNIERHSFRVSTFTFNSQSKLGTYLNASFNLNTQGVIDKIDYDANFRGTQTYISGKAGYSGYFNYGFYQSKKLNADHSLNYEVYFGLGLNEAYGITNNQKFTSNWLSFYPDVSVKWKYKKVFDLKATYEVTYTNLNYDNYIIDKTEYTKHKVGLQNTLYAPKNAFFANDVMYTYNGNISPGFKRDFFLWNVSLGYKFYEDTFIAKVKVYDLLNQNTNIRRTVDGVQIIDQYNTILKRYVMFSLTYKISKFGGKAKNKFKFRDDDDDEE